MDEQDRQDGSYLVLGRDLSSTRRVAQNLPTIVDWKETCTPSCLSCSSMLVSLPKASENPSPVETCTDRVVRVNWVVVRRGGEQTEANNPARSSQLRRLNSIRPVLTWRVCGKKPKLVARAMPMASPSHVYVVTIGSAKVVGVSGVGKCHGTSHETCGESGSRLDWEHLNTS